MGVALAPVNGHNAAKTLARAGAGELYVGFHDDCWDDAFPGRPLNRMSGFGGEANVFSFEQMLGEISSLGADMPGGVFCVFNSLWYTPREEDFIARRYLPALAKAGFTGVILSGPGMVRSAHQNSLAAVASTMCAVYNERLARWHAGAGFDRVIIPRDVSLAEIESMSAAMPEMSFEVFLMRNGCPFADSHCMGLHRAGMPSLCRTLRDSPAWRQSPEAAPTSTRDDDAARINRAVWSQRFHLNTCGLCALWRLERAGVDAYKVVGRGDDVDDLAADVALVARNIEIARSCPSEAAYLLEMHRPQGLLDLCSNEGLSCYYPEVRFPVA